MKRALTGSMIVLMVFFLSAGLALPETGKAAAIALGTEPVHP